MKDDDLFTPRYTGAKPPFDPISREINRQILTRVPERRARLAQILWWMFISSGIALFIVAEDHGWIGWTIAGMAITLGAMFGSIRDLDLRLRAQPGLDDIRVDEIMADRPRDFVVRRRLAFGWPLAFTIMFAIFFVIAFQSGTAPAPLIIDGSLFLACVFSWYLALRQRIPFLRLTESGLYVNHTRIPWQAIADIRGERALPLINRRSKEREQLLLILYDPLPDENFPRGALGRFYRGDNQRELYLSLARTRETPAVIYELVRDFWQKARQTRQVTR